MNKFLYVFLLLSKTLFSQNLSSNDILILGERITSDSNFVNSFDINYSAKKSITLQPGFNSFHLKTLEASIQNSDSSKSSCQNFYIVNKSASESIGFNISSCSDEKSWSNLNGGVTSDCFNGNPYDTEFLFGTDSVEIHFNCTLDTTEIVNCEDFSNHSFVNPHLGARKSTNEFFGQVNSKYTPEYKIDGQTGWKKAQLIEYTGQEYNFYGIVEPYLGIPRRTILRSKDGCPEYTDIRFVEVYDSLLKDWSTLPVLNPISNKSSFDIPIWISSSMEGHATADTNIPIWAIFTTATQYPNLKRKINGNNEFSFVSDSTFFFVNKPNKPLLRSNDQYITKDFVLDLSTDYWQTAQRYVVHRSFFGGHYSTFCSITRHDNHVYASSEVISLEFQQILINKSNGQKYYSNPTLGGLFDLGILPDGDYQFELRTTAGYLIEGEVLLRVKSMQ